jgi:phosphatidylinositol alpha-mannosyltransferase
LSDQEKIEFLQSLHLYVAPNTGGESFGIILTEAMASRTPVLASNIPAFAAVLEDGACGTLFANESPSALAAQAISLLQSPQELTRYSQSASAAAQRYDWNSVATQILHVYESAMVGHGQVRTEKGGR